MVLYGSYTSPFVRHCRIALMQSGLSWQFIEAGLEASAKLSPTQKIPFLVDAEITLSDSSSILRHIRELSGQPFINDVLDYDLYCQINTLLDAAINRFYLEKDGVLVAQSSYLGRQQQRVIQGLEILEQRIQSQAMGLDTSLRLACFLDWGLFRQRLELSTLPKLQQLLDEYRGDSAFAATAPPTDA